MMKWMTVSCSRCDLEDVHEISDSESFESSIEEEETEQQPHLSSFPTSLSNSRPIQSGAARTNKL